MNILVTGGSGFLAGALLRRLRERLAGRLFVSDLRAGPGRLGCDLRDREACLRLARRCRPDLVFHLAGTTRAASWDELWDAHVRATVNLLSALRPRRARVVISGSSAEYGAAGRLPVREAQTERPVSNYGATKLAQCLAALSFRHEGLRVAVARIFNVVGPGMPDHLAVGSFCRQIAEAESGRRPPLLEVGRLDRWRDLIDVRDTARALERLGLARNVEGVYNVCSGRAVSVEDCLRDLLALSPLRWRLRQRRDRVRGREVAYLMGSGRKLEAACGWKPAVGLRQSLADTLEWHRDRGRGRP
ncbi:MAG: NAD-dependent epimerase/dehydratase family protein [Elusimicrobia bacterium]|nr:NAD-dependent epimerase/dehydratase family protein [Elusimicrobiota bacterium]